MRFGRMTYETDATRRDPGFSWGAGVMLFTLLATGLAMGAALAHLLELPNKIGMSQQDYFTTQMAYNGWNRLAWLLLAELVGLVGMAVIYRHHRAVRNPALAALFFLICAQVVFWIFTFPTNMATENWTVVPERWEVLRNSWEYSHAAGALLQFAAFVAVGLAVLRRPQMPR